MNETLARRFFLRLLGLAPVALVSKQVAAAAPPSLAEQGISFDSLYAREGWGKVVGGVILDEPCGNVIAELDFSEPSEEERFCLQMMQQYRGLSVERLWRQRLNSLKRAREFVATKLWNDQ